MGRAFAASPFPGERAMLRNLLLFLATLAAATACTPAYARHLVDLSVVDRDNGQSIQPVAYRGDRWVPGIPGHRYSVRLRNTTGERVLVVLSVDGVNAVSGQTADASQGGYVLGPWESAEIDGWRKSLDEVAQFVFTDLADAYATRTGRPDNVGVIGIAVFREAQRLQPMAPTELGDESRSAAAPSAKAAMRNEAADDAGIARQGIGTGHGDRQWAPVGRTGFERASGQPAQVLQLRYDDMDALVARGIMRRPCRNLRQSGPQAFPGGFVPDPPPSG
jgi:hypothetical protein